MSNEIDTSRLPVKPKIIKDKSKPGRRLIQFPGQQDVRPQVICSKCNQPTIIDMKPFTKNVAEIVSDKCDKCGARLYIGILLLGHTTLEGILGYINRVVSVIQPRHQIIGGERKTD